MEINNAIAISDGVLEFEDFSLEIGDWECRPGLTVVKGANGSGKTSFLRVVLGLLSLDLGERYSTIEPHQMGYVPQNYRHSLLPWATCEENLRVFPNVIVEEALEKLFWLGIPKQDFRKRPSALSGGQCQRLAIVRELALSPELLVLDEPFSSLDTNSASRVGELLATAVSEGTKVIMTSHQILPDNLSEFELNRIEIERIGERVAVLKICQS